MPAEALIGAGTNLIGGLINANQQDRQNQHSMMFSQQMYNRQYLDSIALWHMQNNYNSPQRQMQRYQEAGLNPHLIYGQGAGAGNAGSIPTPSVTPAQFRSSNFGDSIAAAGNSYMNAIYDLEIKKAQADNLKSQNDVIIQDAALKKAQILATMTGEERARFDLEYNKALAPISAEQAKETLRQTKVQTDLSINRDVREAMSNASYLSEAAERIKNMYAQRRQTNAESARIYESINQMIKDGTIKDLEIELKRKGITWGDPLYLRMGSTLLQSAIDNAKANLPKIPKGTNFRPDRGYPRQ